MGILKQVSILPISFGGGAISGEGGGYGFGAISEAEALDLLEYAYTMGIKIFDTAPIYGFGLSEERIGKAFSKQRDKVFIVSKSGVDWHPTKRVNMTNDPNIAQRMLEESLKRLNTDYLDLYMIHWPDKKFDIREPLEVIEKARKQGKIKYIGLCNTNFEDLEKAKEITKIDVVQNEFNYFSNSAKALFSYLEQNNISFMGYGTFDKGILSGRVNENRKFDQYDARANAPWWNKKDVSRKIIEVEEIKKKIEPTGKTLSQFALEYSLSYPVVESAIIGFRNKEQLNDVLRNFKI